MKICSEHQYNKPNIRGIISGCHMLFKIYIISLDWAGITITVERRQWLNYDYAKSKQRNHKEKSDCIKLSQTDARQLCNKFMQHVDSDR